MTTWARWTGFRTGKVTAAPGDQMSSNVAVDEVEVVDVEKEDSETFWDQRKREYQDLQHQRQQQQPRHEDSETFWDQRNREYRDLQHQRQQLRHEESASPAVCEQRLSPEAQWVGCFGVLQWVSWSCSEGLQLSPPELLRNAEHTHHEQDHSSHESQAKSTRDGGDNGSIFFDALDGLSDQDVRKAQDTSGKIPNEARSSNDDYAASGRWQVNPKPYGSFFPPGCSTLMNLLAFYFPDKESPCDKVCGCMFLANFFNVGDFGFLFKAPCSDEEIRFRTAEAAFQATKCWRSGGASGFAKLGGQDAFDLSRQKDYDKTYGGFGNGFIAMWAVLKAKFMSCREAQDALRRTEDAFLLEHNDKTRRDDIWSNNADGEGKNKLGMLLMLVRDEILHQEQGFWTTFIKKNVEMETGEPNRTWQECVRLATRELEKNPRMKVPQCSFKGCTEPTADRTKATPGDPKFCRKHAQAPRCQTPGCPWPTYDLRPGQYCSLQCKHDDKARLEARKLCPVQGCRFTAWDDQPGHPCFQHRHLDVGRPDSKGAKAPLCRRPDCRKPTWNNQPGEYCSKSCRQMDQFGHEKEEAEADNVPSCKRPGCAKPTYNKQPGYYCSPDCRELDKRRSEEEEALARRCPVPGCYSLGSSDKPGSLCRHHKEAPLCRRPDCYKRSYNNQQGYYCSTTCQQLDEQHQQEEPEEGLLSRGWNAIYESVASMMVSSATESPPEEAHWKHQSSHQPSSSSQGHYPGTTTGRRNGDHRYTGKKGSYRSAL